MGAEQIDVDDLAAALAGQRISRRHFVQRATALGLSAGAVSSLLAACGGDGTKAGTSASGTKDAAPSGGTLKVRVTDDIASLDPAFGSTLTDSWVLGQVGERLINYEVTASGEGKITNELAETFESSADGLTHDFVLKEGVLFHGDFGEMTADDVKFSFERIAGVSKPSLESPYADYWKPLEQVKVTGKYTGQIILTQPYAPLYTTLDSAAGIVLSKRAVKERGKNFATKPIGSGPLQFDKWVPKQKVSLTRFDRWRGAKSQWDQFNLVVIPEENAAEIALESGAVDYSQIEARAFDRFSSNDDFEVAQFLTFNVSWLAMNVQNAALQDIRIRQAIRSAVDVPSILTAAYDEKGQRAYSTLHKEFVTGYWPDAPRYERDVPAAQALMKDAGVSSLTLQLVVQNTPQERTVSQIIQQNLRDIGITVDVVVADPSSFYEYTTGKKGIREQQLMFAEYGAAGPEPSTLTIWWTCDQVGVYNLNQWCDADYDRLGREALTETDLDKRAELYIEMQRLLDESASSVWVAHPQTFTAYARRIEPAWGPGNRVPLFYAFRST